MILCNLPAEILFMILCMLDIKSLSTLSFCCKALGIFIQEQQVWRMLFKRTFSSLSDYFELSDEETRMLFVELQQQHPNNPAIRQVCHSCR